VITAHVRRLRCPVLNSPKGQNTELPVDLVRRPIVNPQPYWTWSVVSRRDEHRPSVGAVIAALTDGVGDFGLNDDAAWFAGRRPVPPLTTG
jgi:hypothetical protein